MYYDTTSAKQSSEISPEHMCGVVVFIYLFHFLLIYFFSCNIKNVILLEMYLYSNNKSNSKIVFFHTTMAFGYN